MRKNMYNAPEFERKLKQCGNLSDIHKLLDETRRSYVKLLKESCKPAIMLMKNIFGRLKLNDNYLRPLDDAVSKMLDGINLDPNLTANETAQGLSNKPLLSAYLKHAWKERIFFR